MHILLRIEPIPASILRGTLEMCNWMRPSKRGCDWIRIRDVFQVTGEDNLLMCEAEGSSHAGSNILHVLCQFNLVPEIIDKVTTEVQAAMDVITTTIEVYKRNHALDWRAGGNDDTALAKACGSANERMVRLLIEAGACAHPLGYSNGPPLIRLF